MQDISYTEALKKISSNLKILRRKNNLTQLDVSMKIGLDPSGYRRIEGKNPPNIKFSTFWNLLKLYNVSLTELLK